MPIYRKTNGVMEPINMFGKFNGREDEVYNIYKKNSTGQMEPIWEYNWQVSGWSNCSVQCGGGIQTRSASCMRTPDKIYKEEYFCNGINKPILQQTCNDFSCYWASSMRFHYGRSTAGDTFQLVGEMREQYARNLSFTVHVSDICSTDDAIVYLYWTNKANGQKIELWSKDVIDSKCSDWKKSHKGDFFVTIPGPGTIEFRGKLSGSNNCCRAIWVSKIALS